VSFGNIEGTGNLDSTVGFAWGTNGATAQSGGKVFDLAQTNAVSLIQGAINNVSTLAATLGAVCHGSPRPCGLTCRSCADAQCS
jgi:hypothetical protein